MKEVEILQRPPIPFQRKRVAAYARVSCGKETMLHSLAAQIDYYRTLILGNPQWQFAGIYADEAKTGTKEDREQFQMLLQKCKDGEVDMIITKAISRFARNTVTLLRVARELKEIGVDVYFEEQNIHTISDDGELMLTLLASFAQAESLSCSDNCKWRIRNGFEEGVPTGFRMLGYRLENGQITIVPEEMETVQRIFELYLQGHGIQGIANILNAEGKTTVNGCLWHSSSVARILDNEKYCGDLLLQKSFVPDHISKRRQWNTGQLPSFLIENNHEPIIEKPAFQMVVEKRARRSINKNVKSEQSALTGMIRCDCCGKHYRRKRTAGGVKWCCSTFNIRGKQFCPNSKMIPENTLQHAICEVLGSTTFDADLFLVKVSWIDACKDNLLQIHLKSGETKEYVWADRSRSESWTPEMRAEASRTAKRRYQIG